MSSQQYSMAKRAQLLSNQMIQWRRKLHVHPELSFCEYNTSKFVKEILESLPGMNVQTGTGYITAVVGTLSNGPGPTIAIRADMDALPILETTDHDFCSVNEGVMHACGHDAHTSILLGAAHLLADSFQKNQCCGTIKFIFQPAEECVDENGLTGAVHMVKSGILRDVDACIALHMNPEAPVGEIWVNSGYSMASVDVFNACIYGTGGHGAYPHLGTDPIWMLGPLLQAIHGIVARRVSPLEPSVVSIGQILAGSASNIIPTEVVMQGTLRSYNSTVRELLIYELDKAFSVVRHFGGDYRLNIQRETPALHNHPTVTKWITNVIQELYPESKIIEKPFGLGGEDFANMALEVPGSMFFLGCAQPDGIKRDLHTPIFDIDERSLPVGASILAETAKKYLSNELSFTIGDSA